MSPSKSWINIDGQANWIVISFVTACYREGQNKSRRLFVKNMISQGLPTGAWSRACLQAALARTAFLVRMTSEMLLPTGCHGLGLKIEGGCKACFRDGRI